jgi:hypothetical protein
MDDRDQKPRLPKLPVGRGRYDVGYGKPPESARFTKGRSGNPAGRPRGARNKRPALNEERLKGIILDEAYRTITINESEKRISIPIAQAVVRAMAVNAARGQHRAQRLFAELLTTTETANNTLYREYFGTALNYKKYWHGEIARCKALGLEVPDPIPHPEDISVDMATGTIVIKGPMTPEEKVAWDHLWDQVDELDRDIAALMTHQKRTRSEQQRGQIDDERMQLEKLRAMITGKTKPLKLIGAKRPFGPCPLLAGSGRSGFGRENALSDIHFESPSFRSAGHQTLRCGNEADPQSGAGWFGVMRR